jgi:hypothetical protein
MRVQGLGGGSKEMCSKSKTMGGCSKRVGGHSNSRDPACVAEPHIRFHRHAKAKRLFKLQGCETKMRQGNTYCFLIIRPFIYP